MKIYHSFKCTLCLFFVIFLASSAVVQAQTINCDFAIDAGGTAIGFSSLSDGGSSLASLAETTSNGSILNIKPGPAYSYIEGSLIGGGGHNYLHGSQIAWTLQEGHLTGNFTFNLDNGSYAGTIDIKDVGDYGPPFPFDFYSTNATIDISKLTNYTITVNTNIGGTLTCISPVIAGQTTSCNVYPGIGYGVLSVTGCEGTWLGINPYVTGAVTGDCTVNATFKELANVVNAKNLKTYGLLQSAFSDVTSDSILKALGITFIETLQLNTSSVVTLKGGFDSDFTVSTGYTILNGYLTIDEGTLIVEGLVIE